MEGPALTLDDVQQLIHMCRDGGVSVLRFGDLVLDFFGDGDDEDEEEDAPMGFEAMPSPVVMPASDDDGDEDGYDKLFGGRKPKFKKPGV